MTEMIDPRFAALSLTGADGTAVRLGELWAERTCALVFIRHFG